MAPSSPQYAPKPRERDIVAKIRKELQRRGWTVWKNHGSAYSEVGLPDLMAVHRGEFIAIEVKRPGSKTTAPQRRWLRKLAEQGILAIVATSAQEVVDALDPQVNEPSP